MSAVMLEIKSQLLLFKSVFIFWLLFRKCLTGNIDRPDLFSQLWCFFFVILLLVLFMSCISLKQLDSTFDTYASMTHMP